MSIPTVVIITAIPLEFEAVVAHLRDSKSETHQNTHYNVGEYVTPANRHWRVVVRKLNTMGNYEAAQESIDAISAFSPAYMFFVGVAGGMKEVQLGDVVAASMARGYESVKVEEGVIKQRLHVEYPSHQLVELAFQLASQPEWRSKIIEPQGQPKAYVCPIASGEKVIVSQQFLQQLQQCCSDAVAIEMEAIGFLRTFRKRPEVKGMVIRGISDLIVGKNSKHDKHWQPIAARHAAGFAFAMLDELPEVILEKPLNTEPLPPNPYKGLSAFREADAELFFGRNDDIKDLIAAVHQQPLVLVVGNSGSGKSSLVFAGLTPQLRQMKQWVIGQCRPLNRPTIEVRGALLSLLPATVVATASQLSLMDLIQQVLKAHEGQRLLLIIDQFEELFTLNPLAVQQEMVNSLLSAVETFPSFREGGQTVVPVVLVLTLRADFLSHALSHSPLAKALDHYPKKLLGPVTEEIELRRIIEAPAQQVGVSLEPQLTERILQDAIQQTVSLPLLEFALAALWDKQKIGRVLTHLAYHKTGGVQEALARHAEEVYAAFTPEEQPLLRFIFVQLVRPGEGTEDTRQVATHEQVGHWETLVKQLADARLVVTGRDEHTGQETVEVVHETLLRHWQRLREWMKEDRAFRVWQESVRLAEREWQASKQDAGALLRGAKLLEAEENGKVYGEVLSAREKQYIAASVQEKQRQTRIKQAVVSGLVMLLIVSLVTGMFGWWQWGEAKKQEVVAKQQTVVAEKNAKEARQQAQTSKLRQLDAQAILATKAPDSVNGNFDRALLLAAQAFKEQSNVETQGALLRVVSDIDDRNHHKIKAFLHYSNSVYSVAFSPDGKTLASGDNEGTVLLWDVSTHQPLGSPLQGHRGPVMSVAFSADGQTLASGSDDGTVILWEVKTHQPLGSPLQGHSSNVTSVAFSPDGQTLASGSRDKTIILWDVKTHQPIGSPLQGHSDSVQSVAFSPAGQTLASGSRDETIILWDVKTHRPLGSPLQGHVSHVDSVAFSPDGQTLASGSFDNTVILWDVKTHQPIGSPLQEHIGSVLSIAFSVKSVAFSADGQTLASGNGNGTVILWDVATHLPLGSPLQGHHSGVSGIAFSPDGTTIASGGVGIHGSSIILWDVKTYSPLSSPLPLLSLLDSSIWVTSLVFSANGTLAGGSTDHTIILWEVKTGQPLGAPLQGHSSRVTSVAFSPDGQLLASGSWDKTVILWEVKTHQLLGSPLQGHIDSVNSVAFSPDGQLLASGSGDNTIILWEVKTRQPLGSPLLEHYGEVTSVAFSPDGQTLASGSWDKTVILWDVKTHQPIGSPLQGHSDSVNSVAFSPDGKTLASGSDDKTIILWDVKTHQPIGSPLQGHSDHVHSVAFSPDGKTLASGNQTDTVILWDVKTHQPIGSPIGLPIGSRSQKSYGWKITSLAFSPDGKTLAHDDRLWDIDPQSWYQRACRIANRNLTQEEWQRYLPGEHYQKTCPQFPSGEALALIAEGEQLAAKAEPKDIDAAIAKFNEAFALEPMLKEHPLYAFNPPETKAKKIAASVFISKGESLAKKDKLDKAMAAFKRAQELDGSLQFDPQTKANQLVASDLIDHGKILAIEGKLDEAIAVFKRTQELDANLISADSWLWPCWYGSLSGQATKALESCETAVKLSNEQDARIRDSRGLARALTGNFKGAISDFQFSVQHAGSDLAGSKKQRQEWIKALKKGKNPFTEEVLKSLREE